MPGGDRTGPMGMGPRTGRGAGYCGGAAVPGFMNVGYGRCWFGRGGRGGGRGWRNMFFATGLTGWQRAAMAGIGDAATAPNVPPTSKTVPTELDQLRQQAEWLAASLGQVQRRIDALEKQAAGEESQ